MSAHMLAQVFHFVKPLTYLTVGVGFPVPQEAKRLPYNLPTQPFAIDMARRIKYTIYKY